MILYKLYVKIAANTWIYHLLSIFLIRFIQPITIYPPEPPIFYWIGDLDPKIPVQTLWEAWSHPKSMKSGPCRCSMGPADRDSGDPRILAEEANQNRPNLSSVFKNHEKFRVFLKKKVDFGGKWNRVHFFSKKVDFFSKNGNIQGLWIHSLLGVKYFQIQIRWGMEYLFEKVKKSCFWRNPKRVDSSFEPPYEIKFRHGFSEKIQENPDQFCPFFHFVFFSKKLDPGFAGEGPQISKIVVRGSQNRDLTLNPWNLVFAVAPSCWKDMRIAVQKE